MRGKRAIPTPLEPAQDRAQSVLQQLIEYRSKEIQERKGYVDLHRLVVRLGIERLIYRIGQSPLGHAFILKGAMLLAIYLPGEFRSTRDADFLAYGQYTRVDILNIFSTFCAAQCDDGVIFHADRIQVRDAGNDREYPGFKIILPAQLSTIAFNVEIDLCFGEVVTPPPTLVNYPCLLNLPAPIIRVYPIETIIAEKYHTIVKKGIPNNRMKDFHDLREIAQNHTLDGEIVRGAIIATFNRRSTDISDDVPVVLQPEIYNSRQKQQQWKAFLKTAIMPKGQDFGETCELIKQMIIPVMTAAVRDEPIPLTWKDQAWVRINLVERM